MDKNERIKLKQAELMKSYETLQDEQLKVATDLIRQAAFMAIELEDLAEIISKEGMVETYTNGAHQSGRKISSNAKMYSALIGKYNKIITDLLKLVPPPAPKPKEKPDYIVEAERKAAEAAREQDRRRQAERARDDVFFAAVRRGELTQDQYREYSLDKIINGEASLPGFDPATFGLR